MNLIMNVTLDNEQYCGPGLCHHLEIVTKDSTYSSMYLKVVPKYTVVPKDSIKRLYVTSLYTTVSLILRLVTMIL